MPRFTLAQLRDTRAGAAFLQAEAGLPKAPKFVEFPTPNAATSAPRTVVEIDRSGGKKEQTWRLEITPCPAPRMTRRDQWLKPRRPCVQRYFDFREALVLACGRPEVPDEVHLQFGLPMAPSWSKKKRQEMAGKPHRQRPDIDNLIKGFLDGLFDEDGAIWKLSATKVWTDSHGFVEIRSVWH